MEMGQKTLEFVALFYRRENRFKLRSQRSNELLIKLSGDDRKCGSLPAHRGHTNLGTFDFSSMIHDDLCNSTQFACFSLSKLLNYSAEKELRRLMDTLESKSTSPLDVPRS
jgi:hypothetical protein